jgi:hypothetical protein
MNADCKSSEKVLLDCLHASLSGVGKLSKHLAKMHYTVELKQRDVDEWPMVVNSMASDLSNGIILCKLVSLLLGEVCTLCHKVATAEVFGVLANKSYRALRARHPSFKLFFGTIRNAVICVLFQFVRSTFYIKI